MAIECVMVWIFDHIISALETKTHNKILKVGFQIARKEFDLMEKAEDLSTFGVSWCR